MPKSKRTNPLVSLSKVLLTYPKCAESKEALLNFLKTIPDYGCCVIGQEHHQDGDLHLHAFVKLDKARKLRTKALHSLFDFKEFHADIEFLKKSSDVTRAVKYCIKEDKKPLVDNCDLNALTGTTHERKYNTREILETPIETLVNEGRISPNCIRNIVWAQQYWKLHSKPPDAPDTRGIWLYGPAGTGKSTWAKDFGISQGGFYEKAQNKWFDGYDGEPVIILEDLDTGTLNHYLKIWADKWACKGEVKGGTVWLNHRYFVVTSNYNIGDIAQRDGRGVYDEELLRALDRRFKTLQLPEGKNFFSWPDQDPTREENNVNE